MIDADRVLRPLDDESDAIDRLTTYESPAELAEALAVSWRAVERALRHLLRSDPDAPDDVRLSALSPADMPYDRLIPALSRRNLISLRMAGMAHELMQSAQRAERGDVRAADADAALGSINQLRDEVRALGDRPVLEAAHRDVLAHAGDGTPHEVPPSGSETGRSRWMIGGVLGVAALVALVLLLRGRDDSMSEGLAAFDSGQYGLAERAFARVVDDDPENVSALLYLGRMYRVQGRHEEAADVLRQAAAVDADDADVQRELGYLFLDLGRPSAAVERFRRALELEPEQLTSWTGLIRALRAAGDPEAEVMLQRAPPEVRAALTSELLPPDTL
jgi:tetratricopeptide (TPR) repeat protein